MDPSVVPKGQPEGEDAGYLEEMTARVGAMIVGRTMYEAADHWGERNPFGVPIFVATHRPEEEPATGAFIFVGSFEEAVNEARDAAGDKDVSIGGGGDVIRQGLDAGIVEELGIIVAPVVLGSGKQLFKDFTKSLHLEHQGVRQRLQHRVHPSACELIYHGPSALDLRVQLHGVRRDGRHSTIAIELVDVGR